MPMLPGALNRQSLPQSWKQEGWLGSLQTAAEIGGRFVSAAGAPLPAPGLAQHAPPERTAPNRTAPPYGTAPPRSHRTARPGPAASPWSWLKPAYSSPLPCGLAGSRFMALAR